MCHPLHPRERLPGTIGEEGLFFQDAGHVQDRVLGIGPFEGGIVRHEKLARGRFDGNVRIGVRQGVGNQGVEAVEDRENDDKRCRADRHARDPDTRNDVDHIV